MLVSMNPCGGDGVSGSINATFQSPLPPPGLLVWMTSPASSAATQKLDDTHERLVNACAETTVAGQEALLVPAGFVEM
jgi:hypothetical protein